MKAPSLTLLTLAACLTSSCIYYTEPVPDMPYHVAPVPGALVVRDTHSIHAARSQDAWYTSPPGDNTSIPMPNSQPQQNYAAIPAPAPAPRPSTNITRPTNTANSAPKPAPAVKTAPVPDPKPAPAAARDPKSITNDGPIPVATPVPGDPTRVYNPLDSSKTIRILDKNGKVYPSGKELKVRGTNFHFYVP